MVADHEESSIVLESKNGLLDQLGIGHLEIFVPFKKDEVNLVTGNHKMDINVNYISETFV